jgi:hypothetical protein
MKLQRMKNGGSAEDHAGMFWDGQKWVSASGGATYSNGTFYANGGPVFPVAGAGAMFANGGPTASFYVDGNGRPMPFAMAPGNGQGSGYLQDLPTTMAYGGQIPGAQLVNPFAMNPGPGTGTGYLQQLPTEMKKGGKHKKLSPQQMQMMMQAMQGQGQPPMGGGQPMMGPPQPGMPQGGQAGQMMPSQAMMPQPQQQPMMSGGGIHINPANRGKFNATKKATGKTTEELTHSSNPTTRKRAIFAQNAAKWHHQMGGAVTQGGNMIGENEMYMQGGKYDGLVKYMAEGGNPDLDNDPITGQPLSQSSTSTFNPASTGVVAPPTTPQANWNAGMTKDQSQQNIAYGADSVNAYDPNTGNTDNGPGSVNGQQKPTQKGNGWNNLGLGLGLLGAGLGAASYYSDRRDQRNLRNKQFNDGATANLYHPQPQPGGLGDWNQYGSFRPNQNTPVAAGTYYPKTGEYGGMFATGGKYSAQGGIYHAGQELDLDDAEIARLQKMGYKIDML